MHNHNPYCHLQVFILLTQYFHVALQQCKYQFEQPEGFMYTTEAERPLYVSDKKGA